MLFIYQVFEEYLPRLYQEKTKCKMSNYMKKISVASLLLDLLFIIDICIKSRKKKSSKLLKDQESGIDFNFMVVICDINGKCGCLNGVILQDI